LVLTAILIPINPQRREVKAPITNASTVQILKPSQVKITEPNKKMNKPIYLYSSCKKAAAPYKINLLFFLDTHL